MLCTAGSDVSFQAIEKYNSIFKFLLLVRRTQSALHSLWSDSMFSNRAARRRGVREEKGDNEDTDTVTQTRQHMIFLVDNLQYYLMADVLDSQTSGLKAKLMKTSSFEDVKNYHDQFLTQVQASIFLFDERVSKCLRDTMSVCLKFTQSSGLSSQLALSTAFFAIVSKSDASHRPAVAKVHAVFARLCGLKPSMALSTAFFAIVSKSGTSDRLALAKAHAVSARSRAL